MGDIRLVPQQTLDGLSVDWLVLPDGQLDETHDLETAVIIALLCHARAEPDDVLPTWGDDRRGWWADHEAAEIWDGWPIGSRLWLLSRAKVATTMPPGAAPGSIATPALCEQYIAEALQPFVDRRIISSFSVQLERTAVDTISGSITLYRGNRDAIELQFDTLWQQIRGA